MIRASRVKLRTFNCDRINGNFKYFPHLKKFISESEMFEKPDIYHLIRKCPNIIRTAVNELSTRLTQCEEFEGPVKIIFYPDICKTRLKSV